MMYEKPKVVTLQNAIASIQSGTGKPRGHVLDNGIKNATSPAYEADE